MKKSLVLAMAMAMGVTASAYAANPFSDVPAGHWAYDSISQLADAGVVEGYGATFGGDKLMTRYEMAQIVAKAMAKGANCDKLAAEFADELDALGVRVAKLEKKVDNVKITGQIRYSYKDSNKDTSDTSKGTNTRKNRFRTRLHVNGQINNNWSYYGMLENDRYFNTNKNGTNDDVKLKRAWINGRVGGIKVKGGRVYFVQNDMIDAEADGIQAEYGFKGYKLTGWAGKTVNALQSGVAYSRKNTPTYGSSGWGDSWSTVSAYNDQRKDGDRVYMARVDKKFGKLGTAASYFKTDDYLDKQIIDLELSWAFDKDWKLTGNYFNGDCGQLKDGMKKNGTVDTDALRRKDDNGYMAQLNWKGAKASKPGSYGLWVNYQDRPYSTYLKPSFLAVWADAPSNMNKTGDGYRGFTVGGNYTFAKNIVGTVNYADVKERKGEGKKSIRTIWADVTFSF